MATVTARGGTTSTALSLSGRVTFGTAVDNRPQFPGGILGLDTGDGDFDIWGISRDYYPSHATAGNAWGLQWYGTGNEFRFIGGGTVRVSLDMDNGNIVSTGTLSASGYNNSNWDTAYEWGDHSTIGYLTSFDITTQTDSKYLRSNADDTATGTIYLSDPYNRVMLGNTNNTTTADTSAGLILHQSSYGDGRYSHRLRKYDHGGGIPLYIDGSGPTANIFTPLARFGTYTGNGYEFEVFGDINATGTIYDTGNRVLTVADEGSGNGLDADTVDGVQASSFLRSDADDTTTGVITLAKGSTGTLMSRTGFSDAFGYNASYGTYIGGGASNANRYLYAGGYFFDWSTVQTLWHTGNDGAGSGLDADLWDGNQFSSYLNQAVLTTSSPQFGSYVAVNTEATRAKIRLWGNSDANYTIGFKNGFNYGHLGTNEYAMSFQVNNTSGRGFWWGHSGQNDSQGVMSLTNAGLLTVAKSVSIGEGQSVTSPSTTPLYVYGSTPGTTVFDVQGTSGQLFSVTDDLTGTIFAASDISGIPILEVDAGGVVTVDGTLRVTEEVIAYYSSDERLKKNIKPIENPLEKLKLISGNTFEWDDTNPIVRHSGKDIGVIAQEIEKVLPEIVAEKKGGYKGVQYEKIVALLIESNKALLERVEELESKLK